jgi:hypothetical protein
MKHIFNLILLTFVVNFTKAQTSSEIANMDDCKLFEYLTTLTTESYPNVTYENIEKNYKTRSALLKKLETYFIVFADFKIAPMYFVKSNSNHFSCDKLVAEYELAIKNGSSKMSARDTVQTGKFVNVRNLIIDLCDLNKVNNSAVEVYLSEFKQPLILEKLYYDLKNAYVDNNENNQLYFLPQLVKEQNLVLIAKRMNILDNQNYVYYQNYNSKVNMIKAFEMHHDNDVFILKRGINQDRELTGGFKFTIVTDYLKWRWLRLGCKKQDNILTYQTLSLLGVGYTPYIRYQNNYSLADSLNKYDRPFASFVGIERAKHRTWRKGLVRHKGEFQVGLMGLSNGQKIQAKLHEDVIVSSQYVHGWDKQIANGGRLALQLNHKFDFLLFSSTNRYKTCFRPNTYLVEEPNKKYGCVKGLICNRWCKHGTSCHKYSGFNLIGEFDTKVGTLMTTAGFGLRVSTLDFLRQSGNQMIQSRGNSKDDFGWKFDLGINYRYVVHNSFLEGLGFIDTFSDDPYDVVKSDDYKLAGIDINRHLLILDCGINLKWRKTTVYLRQNFHNLEYRSKLANVDFQNTNFTTNVIAEDIGYYNSTVIEEQKSFLNFKFLGTQIYGYGTLGISWLIE